MEGNLDRRSNLFGLARPIEPEGSRPSPGRSRRRCWMSALRKRPWRVCHRSSDSAGLALIILRRPPVLGVTIHLVKIVRQRKWFLLGCAVLPGSMWAKWNAPAASVVVPSASCVAMYPMLTRAPGTGLPC